MADFVEHVAAKGSRPDLRERRTGARPLPQPPEILHAFEQVKGPWAHPAAEMELPAQHATLLTCRQILERISDGYLVTDAHGMIQQANHAGARLLNIPQELLAGTALASFIAADEWHGFKARLHRLGNADTLQEWSVRLRPYNQPTVEVLLTAIPVRDAYGTVVTLHWLLRAWGEQHRATEQIQQLHASLEERVVARIGRFEAALRTQDGVTSDGLTGNADTGALHRQGERDLPRQRAEGWTDYAPEQPEQQAANARLPGRHMIKNRFIYNLLHGLVDDEATILRDARLLGLDFAPPRAVILIEAADYILATRAGQPGATADEQIRQRVQTLISSVVSFFHLPNDTICAYLGDGQVAVLKASDTKNLVSWVDQQDGPDQSSASWANLAALKRAASALLRHMRREIDAAISIGIGRYHPGIQELTRSYADARAALSLGHRFHGPNGVYCLDGLGIAAFVGVSDEQTKIDLATHLLSPLTHAPELLQTLAVFFAQNCVPSSTAAALAIHRNTLSYRLDKISALTGLNPRCFDDGVQIRLALALRALQDAAA